MIVQPTRDVGLIHRVINHPMVKRELSEGEELPIPLVDSIYYFSAREDTMVDGAVNDAVIGAVAYHPVNSVTWTPHVVSLVQNKGHGREMLRRSMNWMIDNTPCMKFFAAPPEFKMAMIRCFEACGFHPEGVSRRSFLWHGVVYDRILMGYEKGTK